MNTKKIIIVFAVIFLSIVSLSGCNKVYHVTRVIDGDTIEIDSGERIRLHNIDTPEIDEQGYGEAKKMLINLVMDKDVSIVKYYQDDYNRTVGDVYLDNICINQVMIDSGLAKIWNYQRR